MDKPLLNVGNFLDAIIKINNLWGVYFRIEAAITPFRIKTIKDVVIPFDYDLIIEYGMHPEVY
ncbi:hypothetical protein D3C75_623030 [compost metagenome]